jgi:hypothetical protein
MTGDEDDRPAHAADGKAVEQLKPGHVRHAHIGDHAVKAGGTIERREKLFCGRETRRVEVLPQKVKPQRVKHGGVIVDQGDADRISHSSRPQRVA